MGILMLPCVLCYDINRGSWRRRKRRLWWNTAVFACQVDTRDLVMISVCQFDTESPEKIEISLKIISTRLASGDICGIFSWFIMKEEGPSPLWAVTAWAGGPGFQINVVEQASRNKPARSFLPCALLLFLSSSSCLRFFSAFTQQRTVT